MEKSYCTDTERYLSVDDIKNVISQSKVEIVSFDIFDTLLVRPSMVPTDIFYLLDASFPEIDKPFSELRINAEEKLKNPNATLEDIWLFISRSNHIPFELAKTMMEAEIELESRLLTARNDIKEIYQFAIENGKRVVAVSDMYLSSDILLKILHKKGYTNIDQVYVSCEHKKRKDDGKLYDFVLEKENTSVPSAVVHIGDNYESDYRMALVHGITAMYYPSIWRYVLSDTSWWIKALQNNRISDDPYMRIIFSFTFLRSYNLNYRIRKNCCFKAIEDFSQLFLSPLLVSITLDLINSESIQNDYSAIYFAARDGYLPLIVYQDFSKVINTAPGHYLYVSRSALKYGRYRDFFDFLKHFKPDTEYSLRCFIDRFVTDEILKRKITDSFSDTEANCNLLEDPGCAQRILLKFKDELNTYFATQKELAQEYYGNLFLPEQKRQLVFDCGYSGSVSAGLMAFCEGVLIDKYYLWQTQENIQLDERNHTKTFCRFQSNTPFGINLIIEECFSPSQGSHVGFIKRNDVVLPVLEKLEISEKFKNELETIEKEVRLYTNDFLLLFSKYLRSFKITRDDPFSKIAYYAFLKSQTGDLKIFNDFVFPDSYTRGKNQTLSIKLQSFFDVSLQYGTSFTGTGFLIEGNYANIPSRTLRDQATEFKVGIHIHMYNIHLAPEFFVYLKDFPITFDLFLTVTDSKFIPVAENLFNKTGLPNLHCLKILIVPNRGRDIAPWLVGILQYQESYDLFCHVHAKESSQYEGKVGQGWRDYLLSNLLSNQAVTDILNLFADDGNLGVLFPEPFTSIADIFTHNKFPLLGTMGEDKIVFELLHKMGFTGGVDRYTIMYSLGTMMWYRPVALQPLFKLNLTFEDFPEEPIEVGGTIAHAIERLPSLVAYEQGYKSKFFTEFPIKQRIWLARQMESFEGAESATEGFFSGIRNIGVKGALKVYLHKRISIIWGIKDKLCKRLRKLFK